MSLVTSSNSFLYLGHTKMPIMPTSEVSKNLYYNEKPLVEKSPALPHIRIEGGNRNFYGTESRGKFKFNLTLIINFAAKLIIFTIFIMSELLYTMQDLFKLFLGNSDFSLTPLLTNNFSLNHTKFYCSLHV